MNLQGGGGIPKNVGESAWVDQMDDGGYGGMYSPLWMLGPVLDPVLAMVRMVCIIVS